MICNVKWSWVFHKLCSFVCQHVAGQHSKSIQKAFKSGIITEELLSQIWYIHDPLELLMLSDKKEDNVVVIQPQYGGDTSMDDGMGRH